MPTRPTADTPTAHSSDDEIWVGGEEMAAGAFGRDGPRWRRRFGRLLNESRPEERPPVIYLPGIGNCLRRSAWLRYLAERERAACPVPSVSSDTDPPIEDLTGKTGR
jgi:hypothetical protein